VHATITAVVHNRRAPTEHFNCDQTRSQREYST